MSNHVTRVFHIKFLALLFIGWMMTSCQESPTDTKEAAPTSAESAQDSIQRAFDHLSKAIKDDSTNVSAYEERASLLYGEGLIQDAMRDAQRCVALDAQRIKCYHLMSDIYLDQNDVRLSLQALEDVLELDDEHVPTLMKLARLQVIIERHPAAHITLNKVLRLQPNYDEALLLKGVAHRDQGQPVKASEVLQQAIQINPDLVDGHIILGQLFEEAGNPASRRYYDNALRIDPNNRQAKLALAGYSWTQGDIEAAMMQYDSLLSDHPGFVEASYNRGLLRMELKEYRLASEDLARCVSIRPDFIYGYFHLGEAMRLQGNLEAALNYTQRASRMSPNDQRISNALQAIKEELGQ